ncbi:Uncharacterized protein Adt_27931 [Abeliophyllum distichum]|uniref:Uncharacterized protein n=1 Tax=Abeliophyllum distichum TaxID=126358 RepID=A0ABD1RV48_9LAMI
MPVTRRGYKSAQVSQEKSTRGGGKRSTRNDYGSSEANILNDELEDEHIADAFHSEDMYRSNNRGRGHRNSPTRGGYTFGQASQRRSTKGGGTRSIRENDGHQEPNTLNDELEDEHIDDMTKSSNKTRGPNRGTPNAC